MRTVSKIGKAFHDGMFRAAAARRQEQPADNYGTRFERSIEKATRDWLNATMKTTWILLFGLFATFFAHGQGSVGFNNTSTTRIYTNNGAGGYGLMSGNHTYRIGLYVGPLGSDEPSLQLVGLATNAFGIPPFDGRFNGGNPFYLPGGYPGETTIAFQVRVWSFFAGLSYEEASAFPGSPFLGSTAIGYVTPASGITPVPQLFGSNPGQLSGLQFPASSPTLAKLFIEPESVPEPSTYVLGALAVMTACLFRRRRNSSPRQTR